MAFNVDAEDVDAALAQQTIKTDCACRCLLVTGYSAVTFNTKAIVTCLHCVDTKLVLSAIATTLKDLKYQANKRSFALAMKATFLATSSAVTMGASEIATCGIGVSTATYLAVRLAHLVKMIFRLKEFKKAVRENPELQGCQCTGAGNGGLDAIDGKCDLTFRNRPDDNIGNPSDNEM